MKYEKWRELIIDPFSIPFKNFKLTKIINYPPAGNDVIEAIGKFNQKEQTVFIKIERSKMADFQSEFTNLNILQRYNYYNHIPRVLEFGKFEEKEYLILSKIEGRRLSEILNSTTNHTIKSQYLLNYGKELAIIHSIPSDKFKDAKQRIINDIPQEVHYKTFDSFIVKYIAFLKETKPIFKFDCFIHGDFHYANILWKDDKINGVLDFEYSGKGLKEQDIAWALILRPGQKFMDQYDDLKLFLNGYKSIGNYDRDILKWCLINGYCHFYLMNKDNIAYKQQLKTLLETIYISKL